MANLRNTNIDSTAHIRLPNGTTAQRPASPQAGMLRFNTTFNITEFYNGSHWIDAESGLRAGLNGSTQALASPNAAAILALDPNARSGDYWIQPAGQTAYKIYCDMTNRSGGWMLVGAGREGGPGLNSWWATGGTGDFSTDLRARNLGLGSDDPNTFLTRNPRYMPSTWVRAAVGSNTWSGMQMIVNRIEIGDSYRFFGPAANNFDWANFAQSGAPFTLTSEYYSQIWGRGSIVQSNTGNNWTDTLNYGGAIDNNKPRTFTWTWGGHINVNGQYNGWSAGSACHFPGFMAANEGHSLQFVNIFVRAI
jgi:hypothetical protein